MRQKNFISLLEQIENNSFRGSELTIKTRDGNGDLVFPESINFDDQAAIALVGALKKNNYITKLDLSCNAIGNLGLKALATSTNIKELFIGANFFSIEGFAEIIQGNFEVLDVSATDFSSGHEEYCKSLIEVFSSVNKSIKHLILTQCELHSDPMDQVIDWLIKTNGALISLGLSWNYLGDDCLKSLPENCTLKHLYIANNQLTDASATFISNNIYLKNIYIDKNNFTDSGAKIIAEANFKNTLSICDNQLTEKGVYFLIKSNFENISFDDNLISYEQQCCFYEAFSELKHHKSLMGVETPVINDLMYI